MNKLLTVDELKAACEKILYFGLGFVRVKVSDSERYHFYHPSFPAFVETPHNHRYTSKSEVIVGALSTTLWTPNEDYGSGARVHVTTVDCGPSPDFQPQEEWWGFESLQMFMTYAGSSYVMPMDMFHAITPYGKTVTKLTLGPKVKPEARAFVEENRRCPFSKKLSDAELWEIVADCLS